MRPLRAGAATITAAIAVLAHATGASAMSLSFSWSGIPACGTRPPAFTLADVPDGAARLAFTMTDLNVPTFRHGGGTVAYQGGDTVAAGAFAYKGPCPPGGQHTYRWTVQALDAAGKVLATAVAAEKFPPR
jgi:phosphatidylethanolamine-binding protein (PEBP) family uncharacterized protein